MKTMELSDVDGQIEQKMEQKYSENLQQLRQEYEDDLKRNKEDLRKIFEEKVRSITDDQVNEFTAFAYACPKTTSSSAFLYFDISIIFGQVHQLDYAWKMAFTSGFDYTAYRVHLSFTNIFFED